MERYQLGLDYYRRFPDEINAITREQIKDAAAHYLQLDKLAVAVAGPPHPEV
jgi:zinc protease